MYLVLQTQELENHYDVSKRAQDKTVIDYAKGKLDFSKGKKPGFFTGPGTFKLQQSLYNVQKD